MNSHSMFSFKYGVIIPALLMASGTLQAAQHALLIGVSDYADTRVPDLEGPIHDVEAVRSVLVRNWQFEPDQITTLVNDAATEQAILEALDSLTDTTRPGDEIIIYFSGHGTSASDVDLGARLNLPDGTGAIVANDFSPEKLRPDSFTGAADDGILVGRFELKPRFQKLDKDRNVLVMFDACFSGSASRALASGYTPVNKRQLNLDGTISSLLDKMHKPFEPDSTDSGDSGAANDTTVEPFKYKNTVYFGAAAEDQFAVDFSQKEIDAGLVSSIDGKPHGGFTDALLRVLETPRKQLSFARLFNRLVSEFNIHCKVCGHTPVSLPIIDNVPDQLLTRPILQASAAEIAAVRPPGTGQQNAEFIQPEYLIVDTQQALLLPSRAITLNELTGGASPDVYFERDEEGLMARSADGQLITRFAESTSTAELRQWLGTRQWLKARTARDLLREQGELRVDFRNPALGNQVTEGDYVYFTMTSETDANLFSLVMDASGKLSVLYPVNDNEAHHVLATGSVQRLPALEDQPIQVTPPWGIDTVLFYAVPTGHAIMADVLALSESQAIALDDQRLARIETLLDGGTMPYSASSIRIVANQRH